MTVETQVEGTVFKVPLDSGNYGYGVVARSSPSGICLGYFVSPEMSDRVDHLQSGDSIYICMFDDVHLAEGLWPIVGTVDPWVREDWPLTDFYRVEEFTGRSLRVVYKDDLNTLAREFVDMDAPDSGIPEDGLAGPVFVEERLSRIVSQR